MITRVLRVPEVRTNSVDHVSCMFTHSIVVMLLHNFPFLALLIGLLHVDVIHISLLANDAELIFIYYVQHLLFI